MRKLKLDLDALRVESFESDAYPRARGTAHAHEDLLNPYPDTNLDCGGGGGGGWGSWFGDCYTEGTCIGPTYCCPATWRPTCNPSCNLSCPEWECGL